jgi:nucleotide-binding universal stress UspA family protein
MDVAVDLCRSVGARLVLHHNVVELAVGSGVGWMWATSHPDSARTAEQKVLDLLARVPAGTTTEARLTHGPVADAIFAVARDSEADVVVMSTRGGSDGGNHSVTQRVLERGTVPVFAVPAEGQDHATPRFAPAAGGPQKLLVPTDLTGRSQRATEVAFDLARRFGFEVHLLHVLPNGPTDGDAADDARRRMAAIIPTDVPRHSDGRVHAGDPAAAIASVADELSAVCIVMGEHVRRPLRYWFRRATSMGVLHRAPCPIWYVPDAEPPDSLVDQLQATTFPYWPASYLYAVIDDPGAAEVALADLVVIGIPKDQMRTLVGASGKETIDPTGEHHTRAARLWRAMEKATPERGLIERYAKEAEQGHVCIGVRCRTVDRDIIADILRRRGAHLLSYFSIGSVERLSE